jgi:hypothetical protein
MHTFSHQPNPSSSSSLHINRTASHRTLPTIAAPFDPSKVLDTTTSQPAFARLTSPHPPTRLTLLSLTEHTVQAEAHITLHLPKPPSPSPKTTKEPRNHGFFHLQQHSVHRLERHPRPEAVAGHRTYLEPCSDVRLPDTDGSSAGAVLRLLRQH